MRQRESRLAEKKLRDFARQRGLDLRVSGKPSKKLPYLAFFDPTKRRIRVWSKLRKIKSEFLYIMAHEIGHSIDFDTMTKRDRRLHDQACGLFHVALAYGCKFPGPLRNFILKRERTANRNGERLMKQLGIKIPPHRLRFYRESGIAGYRKLFSQTGS